MDIIRLCGIIVICIITSLILGRIGNGQKTYVICAGIVLIFAFCIPKIGKIADFVTDMQKYSPVSDLFPIILKVTAVALICELCSGICDASGENSISRALIFAGRTEIVFISLPLIKKLYDSAVSLADGG